MSDPSPPWPWLSPRPLILASGSGTRAAMLRAAGIRFEVVKPDVDERAIDRPLREGGVNAIDRALALARAKAQNASESNRGDVVLGADQTLEALDHPGTKAADRAEAKRFLQALSGQTHCLHSAAAFARDGSLLFSCVETATLRMRELSDDYIDAYLDHVGDDALSSVGSYRIEEFGAHLFERIDGDHDVILGLPLAQSLSFLRRIGWVA
ncbi:Maf family protein [Terrarubrum flagellatum]|uniref:Maf family protein n=1 Tax=Terrirubrum flagellatum TaxID=2895980 RepID=UPI0031453154